MAFAARLIMMNYINIFQNHFKYIFPEIYLFFIIVILILYALFIIQISGRSSTYIILSQISIYVARLTIFALFLATALSLFRTSPPFPLPSVTLFHGTLIVDDLTITIQTIIILSSLFVLLASLDYLKGQKVNSFE